MKTPILFVDRDGTLITEPEDFQIDAYEKLQFFPDVIPALLRFKERGYEFVIVTNQDGLGTESFSEEGFAGPHQLMLDIFASQGITFREVLIDRTFKHEGKPTRKPEIGLVQHYINRDDIDWERSAMVGDRDTDVLFGERLNIRGFQLKTEQFGGDWTWPMIASEMLDQPRTACVVRNTRETSIEVCVNLDVPTEPVVETGLEFFNHMLAQIGTHGNIGLSINTTGDLQVDEHHTIEDTGIVLGEALKKAIGSKHGIGRYAFVLPMDESLAMVALDFGGRPTFEFDADFTRDKVGDMPTEMVSHFFESLAHAAGMTLHMSVTGENDHHQIESLFKGFARALRSAIAKTGSGLPSTKGAL